jgi:hypothetical protein
VQSDPEALTVQVSATGGSQGGADDREIILDLANVHAVESIEINGKPTEVKNSTNAEHLAAALRIPVGRHRLEEGLTVHLTGVTAQPTKSAERAFELLDRAQMEYQLKHRALDGVTRTQGIELAQFLDTVPLPESLRGALVEVAD